MNDAVTHLFAEVHITRQYTSLVALPMHWCPEQSNLMGTVVIDLCPDSDQVGIRARFGQICNWKDAQGETSVSAMTVRLIDVHGGFSSVELNWAFLPKESQVCGGGGARTSCAPCSTQMSDNCMREVPPLGQTFENMSVFSCLRSPKTIFGPGTLM